LPVNLRSLPDRIPDRTEYLEGRISENPAQAISEIFLDLDKSGALVAAIACNTAHAPIIFNEIKRILKINNSSLAILNIVTETLKYLNDKYDRGTRIGVLSTTGTWRNGIYTDALNEQGFKTITPSTEREQDEIHQTIYNMEYGVKACGNPISDKAKDILYSAAQRMIKEGAEVIILGCTEIPLVIKESNINNVPLVDTLRVLARSLINYLEPRKIRDDY